MDKISLTLKDFWALINSFLLKHKDEGIRKVKLTREDINKHLLPGYNEGRFRDKLCFAINTKGAQIFYAHIPYGMKQIVITDSSSFERDRINLK